MKKTLLTLRLGIFSLLLHKLRSGLAVLGILIGITSVIWLVAMGEGISHQAQQQIKDLGATNIIVISVKPAQESSSNTNTRSAWMAYGLKRDDYDRIRSNIPVIKQAVPMRVIRKEVRYIERTVESRLVGCTPEYFGLNHLTMAAGRFLTDRDLVGRDNICVIAEPAAEKLFAYENPIGKSVQVDKDFYIVVGVTARRDPAAAIGGSLSAQDYNLDVYIPLDTLRARIGDMVYSSKSGSSEGEIVELSQVTLSIEDDEMVEETADIIRKLLDDYHKDQQDVAVVVPKELLKQAKLFRMMFNVLLILIAGISLLVGGIGIMNIMLATVTERTREIGIRRALGARRTDIIQQFVVEAVVLTGVGGALGIGCGSLVRPAVKLGQNVIAMRADLVAAIPQAFLQLEPRITPWSIWLSLGISVFVGLVFGLYPAYRAAMMDPIEALRHE